MQSVLRTDTQSIAAQNFGDFCHRARRFKSEIAHNHVCFIDEHPRSFLEFCQRDTRINIAVIIGASHHDVRRVFRSRAEKCADAVRG